ncbi:adenosylcobinamide-GDP ribazoletransferase [Roseomonas sp. OT10]|uniref:adenosylcobinamide-GDP ribazoletransferase n=1 Tax=Roseomonas cutis TaxID=2897332 RepID=UPI001E384355|nr:adenosylcobinamide-GDP ribazoletransferase [Roseomonas sp. OT10]UFN49453.1 adenosylcobinamide-GDP ribazoletransferase [Roseomonas sp. OT10]
MGGLARDLGGALALLTRLPAHRLLPMPAEAAGFARGVWAYPLVGALAGAIGGGVWWAGRSLGLPPLPAACWALAALLLATGAFHEDGLADTADGFGGGRTRERKLEIMRDSRIGSYGALALALCLALRGTALATLSGPAGCAALVASGALGRGAILGLLRLLPPARADGMAAALGRPGGAVLAAGLGLAALPAALLLPWSAVAGAVLAAPAATLALAALARRQIGGHTGDVLGAGSVVAECTVLSLLAALAA